MKTAIRISLALLGLGIATGLFALAWVSSSYLDSLCLNLGAVMALTTGILGAMEVNSQ